METNKSSWQKKSPQNRQLPGRSQAVGLALLEGDVWMVPCCGQPEAEGVCRGWGWVRVPADASPQRAASHCDSNVHPLEKN